MRKETKIILESADISSIDLGIVCPMANEIGTAKSFITAVLAECEPHNFRNVTFFAVIDRVSRDGTLNLLNQLAATEPRLVVVWSPENTSVVDAYVRGYREALDTGCDWLLEIDAGFSHHPADIAKFVEKMRQGYSAVFGSRFCAGGSVSDSPIRRRVFSRGGTILANFLLGTQLTDMTSGYELFRRDAMGQILENGIRSRGHFFQTEIRAFCHRFAISEVPIEYRSASPSVNNASLWDAFKNLLSLFIQRLGLAR